MRATSRKNRKPAAAADLRAMQILLWFSVLIRPVLVLLAFFALACTRTASASDWTIGKKSLLLIRLDFPDIPGDPVSETNAAQNMQVVDKYYRDVSDGKLSIHTTIAPTFRMRHPATWYATNHAQRDIDARAAAKAAGFDPAKYDLEIMVFNVAVGGDGFGMYGSKGVFLAPPISFSGIAHELGHNFGLPHNAVWKTWDGGVIGPGTEMTYADSFDTMGGGGDDTRMQFSVRSKAKLGWYGAKDIIRVTNSGRYRIYAHDLPGAAGPRGLRIARDGTNAYWVEFRQLIAENPWMMNGVRILKCGADETGTLSLLDMTPDSPAGCKDAPLLPGRTFVDGPAGIYLTPIGKGNTIPESMDIEVNLGHYPLNHPPTLAVTASTRTANADEPVVFQASAHDPDGDELAYSWDFGDGTFEWGKPVVTHRWKTSDRDFTVRCSVSDMKGGSVNRLLVMSLGHPPLHRLVGSVTVDDQPVENVLVAASTTNNTRTDSIGSFALTDLAAGKHRITARIAGYWVKPVTVDCPAAESLRLTAYPLGRDAIVSDAGIELQEGDLLNTPASFRPPVEINLVAKTSATNLRMGYAADQVIFNWEVNGSELRVDGGPANGRHKPGAGAIPRGKYVAVRWLVTPKSQAIYVNGVLRFRHEGDYSQIDRPVSVFTAQSTVTVKSLRVTQLPSETR